MTEEVLENRCWNVLKEIPAGRIVEYPVPAGWDIDTGQMAIITPGSSLIGIPPLSREEIRGLVREGYLLEENSFIEGAD